jgi:hypothetical protein
MVVTAIRERASARVREESAGGRVFCGDVHLSPDSIEEVDETTDLLVLEYDVVFTHRALPGGRVGFRRRTALEHWWPGDAESVDGAAHDGLNRVLVDADEDGNDRVSAALER